MRRPRLASTLVGRVALASALAAALGGSAAALASGFTANELIERREARVLQGAAYELSQEVREELQEDGDEQPDGRAPMGDDVSGSALARALADELDDLELPGALAAVQVHGRTLAGERTLPALEADRCIRTMERARPLRVCAVPLPGVLAEATLLLAAPAQDERDRESLLARAAIVGVLCSALLGGALSYGLARWALSPLTQLGARVRAVPVDEPRAELLGGPLPQPEIEGLRAAVAGLLERLGSALQQAQTFAASAAHELRTPLATLVGELELLAEQSDPRERVALARFRVQLASLSALVERLLVLAQPTRLALASTEAVDLGDVCDEVLEPLEPSERARIHADVGEDVLVRGDPALLRTLLANALGNACKFSAGRVDVQIRTEGDAAEIHVIDDGPGIAPAERERVFVPFYRSSEARTKPSSGHGIGLALIARIAWSHHGSAELLDSARGAHLRIRLPAWRATPAHTDVESR